MGTNLSFISTYHPQTDEQIEVVNKSLGNLLRSLVTEQGRQWDQILAQTEFAFNNSVNRSIGKIPFEIVYERQPRGIAELIEFNQMNSGALEQNILLHKCKDFMIKLGGNCRIVIKSISTGLIRKEEKFNLKWEMNF
jgi:hypothetical protein